MKKKYRLITRSDFDGLASAVILKNQGLIDNIKFVHPKDMQDGKVLVTCQDITTNLPYVDGVHLAFDHHVSETIRKIDKKNNFIVEPNAPSASRVVYNYYTRKGSRPKIPDEMLKAVDKADSAKFTSADILEPKGWVLLNFIMDPRTGLGRFKDFRISNYNLMMNLIDHCNHYSIDEILKLPNVVERFHIYCILHDKFIDQLKTCSKTYKNSQHTNRNLLYINLKNEEAIYPGNRFEKYVMFPDCNLSILEFWGLNKKNTVFAVGRSVTNRSSIMNIGKLMLQNGGGGHRHAATCQVDNAKASTVRKELINQIIKNK